MTATNRRDLLGRVICASAAGILAAPAPLAAASVDRHVAWGARVARGARLLQRPRTRWDQPQGHA